jgi:signal transduction histidine kinase
MATGVRKQVEEPLVDKKGKKIWIETIKTPIFSDKGEIIGTTGISRDITERKKTEEELRRIAKENARLFKSVKRQREQLRALTTRLAESEEIERHRLARELHDQVGQNLTALGLSLNIIQAQLPEESSQQIISKLEDSLTLVEQTTERIRNVMADLKPPVLDDYGLVSALRWHGTQFSSRTGIRVSVNGEEPSPRLTPHIENAMFRIAQEALTNAAKHAQTTHVSVAVEVEKKAVRLIISDNGIGFDPKKIYTPGRTRSWGLLTMSERAEAIGGRFNIESRPGHGTNITVEVSR